MVVKYYKVEISLGQQLESFSNAISVGGLHETSRCTNIILILQDWYERMKRTNLTWKSYKSPFLERKKEAAMFCLRRTGKEFRKLFSGKNGVLYGKSGPQGLLLTTERSAGKPSALREWHRCKKVYNRPSTSTRLENWTTKDGVHQHIGLEGTGQTGEENAIWHSWTRRDSPNVRYRQWRN